PSTDQFKRLLKLGGHNGYRTTENSSWVKATFAPSEGRSSAAPTATAARRGRSGARRPPRRPRRARRSRHESAAPCRARAGRSRTGDGGRVADHAQGRHDRVEPAARDAAARYDRVPPEHEDAALPAAAGGR